MDATVACVDQIKRSVQVEPRIAWFPRGTQPSVELSDNATGRLSWARSPRTAIGFSSQFEEYVTADHTKNFILVLCNEFEDDLIVVLDGAPYFQASAVTDPAAGDNLAFVTSQPYSPE